MKKINLGICFGIIMISLCLLLETGFAATYYVKNTGNDNASGLDDNTAWRTVTNVNRFNFSEGDVVLFKRGDTFSDARLKIQNVKNFMIADYGEGEKPLFDGNKIRPIFISDSKNVTVKNVDISGQEWLTTKSYNLVFSRVEDLVIDGVYGNGHTMKNGGVSKGKTAIWLNACSGVIEIKNCELFNWGPYDLQKPDTEGFMGIFLSEMENGEYKIHDNKIYSISSDAIHISKTKANGLIYDNILYNSGEDGIDVTGSENVDIYENKFYRTPEFLGEDWQGSEELPAYINLRDYPWYSISKNITIRSNNFMDGDCVAIKLGNTEDTNIFENIFSNVKSALYIQDLVKNTKFHHNVIENPRSRPNEKGVDTGGIYENNSYTGTQIYNNTIYNGKGDCKHLIALECSNKTSISNNIVYQNNSSEDAFGLYHNPCGTNPVIRDNYWYNPGKINRTNYSNKIYTANMQEEWNEKHSGDKFDAPLMNDPEEGDYSLYEKSLKLGAVYDELDVSVAATDDSTTDATFGMTDEPAVITPETSIAKEYYVSPSGDDGAPGSKEKPYATLSRAIQEAKKNDVVFIMGGEYYFDKKLEISTPGPILFKAYENQKPVFIYKGEDTYAVGIQEKATFITLEGLTFIWASNTNGNIIGTGAKNTTIRGCTIFFDKEMNPEKYDGIKIIKGADNTAILNCTIHGAPNQGIDTVGADNLVIRGNTIFDCQNAIVLKGGSDNNLIEENHVFNLKYGAIGLGGTTSAKFIDYQYENTGSIVRNNLIRYENADNVGAGVFLWGAKDSKVYNNTLLGAAIHIQNGGDPVNKSIVSRDNFIANNVIWRTGNVGLLVVDEGNEQGLTMMNNLYWKTTGSGEFKISGKWLSYDQFISQFTFSEGSLFDDPLIIKTISGTIEYASDSPVFGNGAAIQDGFTENSINIGAPLKTVQHEYEL
jgi:parallel beta-helix repeat protein